MDRPRTIAAALLAPAVSICLCIPTVGADPALRIVSILQHDEALHEAPDVELSEDGTLAFVPGKGGSIAIVRVTGPARPELLWFRHDRKALPNSETVLPRGHRLFLGTEDFHSIDINDPRAPKFEGLVSDRTRVRRINGMARSGDSIFAACKEGWIVAFDISDAIKPRLAGSLETRETHDLCHPHDIDLFGPHVVVVDARGFGREDKLGKLAALRSVEAFPTPDDNAHDPVYRDGYLCVSGQGDNRFVILAVEDSKIRRLAENVTQASSLCCFLKPPASATGRLRRIPGPADPIRWR